MAPDGAFAPHRCIGEYRRGRNEHQAADEPTRPLAAWRRHCVESTDSRRDPGQVTASYRLLRCTFERSRARFWIGGRSGLNDGRPLLRHARVHRRESNKTKQNAAFRSKSKQDENASICFESSAGRGHGFGGWIVFDEAGLPLPALQYGRRSGFAHIRAALKVGTNLPSISWRPEGGAIDSCQRREPPEAVAKGQHLQGSSAPPESSAEIGA